MIITVFITLVSTSAADTIAASLLKKGRSISPVWNGENSLCAKKDDSVSCLMGFEMIVEDSEDLNALYDEVNGIITNEKIHYYSLIVQGSPKDLKFLGAAGNIQFSSLKEQKPITNNVIKFPSKINKPADGIIEDDQVPPPNQPTA